MLAGAPSMDLARALRQFGFDSLPDADTIQAAWATAMRKPDAGESLNEARDVLLRYEAAWQVKQQALRDRVEFVRGLPFVDLPRMNYACAMRHLGDALPDAEAVERAWRSSVEGMVPARNVSDPFSRERRLNQAREVLLSMLGSPEHHEAMRLDAERQEAARMARLEAERRENARKEQERLDAERIEAERASERKSAPKKKRKEIEPATYKSAAMKILGLSGDTLDVKAVEKAWEFQVENTKTPRRSLDPYAKTRQLHKAKDVLLGSMGSEAQQKAAEQLATELLMSGGEAKKKRRKIGTVKINIRITEFAGTVEEFNERRLFLAQWANSVCALFESQRCHMDVSMKVH
jgi:hypothetical protein